MKTKPVFKNNGAQEQIVTLYFLELSIIYKICTKMICILTKPERK